MFENILWELHKHTETNEGMNESPVSGRENPNFKRILLIKNNISSGDIVSFSSWFNWFMFHILYDYHQQDDMNLK